MSLMPALLILAVFQFCILPADSLTPWNVTASQFKRTLWTSTPTLSIDLSTSWSTSSVVINEIIKPPGIFGGSGLTHPGLFWQESSKSFIVFGGGLYNINKKDFSIWEFTPASGDGKWSEIQSFSPKNQMGQTITWPQGSSYAFTPTGGFVVGGYTTTGTTTVTSLNMTTVNTNNNTYVAATDIGAYSTSGVVEGGGFYVPAFGTGQGIVVYIGGYVLGPKDGSNFLHPMSSIRVYDIASGRWSTQTAGGDVPTDRKDICITGAWDTNSSSYEIFVYGGCGLDYFNIDNNDSRNVYILTLPAFRWIRTPDLTTPRAGSNCHTINNQMLSYGSFDPTGTASYSDLDDWTYGIGIFDLTALTWSSNYNANASPYMQSDKVKAFYSNNSLYPVWDNPSVASLFTTPSSSPTTPTTSTTPKSTNTPSKSKKPVAPIVGGVVGGVVVLVAFVLLFWFYCAKNRLRGSKDLGGELDNVAQAKDIKQPSTYGHELDGNAIYSELETDRRPELGG